MDTCWNLGHEFKKFFTDMLRNRDPPRHFMEFCTSDHPIRNFALFNFAHGQILQKNACSPRKSELIAISAVFGFIYSERHMRPEVMCPGVMRPGVMGPARDMHPQVMCPGVVRQGVMCPAGDMRSGLKNCSRPWPAGRLKWP